MRELKHIHADNLLRHKETKAIVKVKSLNIDQTITVCANGHEYGPSDLEQIALNSQVLNACGFYKDVEKAFTMQLCGFYLKKRLVKFGYEATTTEGEPLGVLFSLHNLQNLFMNFYTRDLRVNINQL